MKVTIHQPDLLPYSGFWFKMATSDIFVVAVHDQFQKHGYQRRVTMRESWCSHQLVGKPSLVPINEVAVATGWQQRITDVIRGRYAGARHFSSRGSALIEQVQAVRASRLDDVNLAMIEIVRDMLGISTPLVVTDPPTAVGTERLIEQVSMVGGTTYLAGSGGRSYMGDDPEARFADAGLGLEWSDHEHVTGDSVVSLLMDVDDPLELVLRRKVQG
jgi:hypothetical protein